MQSDGPDIDRLEPLFHEALDLEPAARAAFLDARCAGDADLRARLEYLLDAASAAEDEPFWRHNAIEAEASGVAEELDASIPDRYRLLARIGAGGMGAVYKALRADDEYAKVVAVKIVQASDPRMVERFKTERQILAPTGAPRNRPAARRRLYARRSSVSRHGVRRRRAGGPFCQREETASRRSARAVP